MINISSWELYNSNKASYKFTTKCVWKKKLEVPKSEINKWQITSKLIRRPDVKMTIVVHVIKKRKANSKQTHHTEVLWMNAATVTLHQMKEKNVSRCYIRCTPTKKWIVGEENCHDRFTQVSLRL